MTCFYQIVNGISPLYLNTKITARPPQVRSSRSLSRNSAQIVEPKCRITCYQKSFFPDCIKMWNLLNNETVNSISIDVFKSNLLPLPHYARIKRSLEVVQYNSVLKGHNGKIVTQFRLGLSPLRSELFTYNTIDNPFCPMCGDEIENLKHFLFDCVKYCEPRENLAIKITALFNVITNCTFLLQIISTQRAKPL